MTAHPDCAARDREHEPHDLAGPGGNKPGSHCNGNPPPEDDEPALVVAGGWCAPSAALYAYADREAFDLNLDPLTLPEVRADRGGIRYGYRDETPAERAAREALQAMTHRAAERFARARQHTIDAACVTGLIHGWDVHVYEHRELSHTVLNLADHSAMVYARPIGIAFTDAAHAIPTLHLHRDHDVAWMDDDEWYEG